MSLGAKRQASAPVSSAVADGGNLANSNVVNRQCVNVHYSNQTENNPIEEVINGNHPDFPALTGRLPKPANQQ